MWMKCGVSFSSGRCWWPTQSPLQSKCTCLHLLCWLLMTRSCPLPKEQEPLPTTTSLKITSHLNPWTPLPQIWPMTVWHEIAKVSPFPLMWDNSSAIHALGLSWGLAELTTSLSGSSPLLPSAPWEHFQTRVLWQVLLPPKDLLAQMPTVFWRKFSPVQRALLNSHTISQYPSLRASRRVEVSSC